MVFWMKRKVKRCNSVCFEKCSLPPPAFKCEKRFACASPLSKAIVGFIASLSGGWMPQSWRTASSIYLVSLLVAVDTTNRTESVRDVKEKVHPIRQSTVIFIENVRLPIQVPIITTSSALASLASSGAMKCERNFCTCERRIYSSESYNLIINYSSGDFFFSFLFRSCQSVGRIDENQ